MARVFLNLLKSSFFSNGRLQIEQLYVEFVVGHYFATPHIRNDGPNADRDQYTI